MSDLTTALDKLADQFEYGHLLASTNPAEFIDMVSDRIEELEGIGEWEACQRCKRKYYPVVWDAPDWLWEKVTDITNGSGLYCPDCFSKMAKEKKITLYWEPCVDHFPRAKLKLAEDAFQKIVDEKWEGTICEFARSLLEQLGRNR